MSPLATKAAADSRYVAENIECQNDKVVNFRLVMNTTIEQIKPETLALIEKQAEYLGLSVDEYLRRLLPADERELALESEASDDEFESDMSAFAEGTEDLASYNGTYSREDIYVDHD